MIELFLDGEKPVSLNKYYAGKHWSFRHNEANRVHDLVVFSLMEKLGSQITPFPVPVVVEMTYYYTGRAMDADNIMAKLYIDGLVKAGLLEDDDPRYVRAVVTRSIETNGYPAGVKLVVIEESKWGKSSD